jgi:hypothetical protein
MVVGWSECESYRFVKTWIVVAGVELATIFRRERSNQQQQQGF